MNEKRVDLLDYWYNEKDCLGAGSFGEVYKGHGKKDASRLFAIKRIRRDKIDQREIQILQEISAPGVQHSNLVKFEDYIEDKGGLYVYLVMEFCDGGDLDKYLKEKKTMNEASLKIFLKQIVPAMKVLYDHNIIHRDLKPANILLSHNGSRDISEITFRIADFGVGRFLSFGDVAETLCGTPAFMAPELFVRNPKYDYKVDLWSIGAIIYLCITGQLADPFRGPIKFPDNITPSLKDLLSKLLCIEPKKRITFDEFYHHHFIGMNISVPPAQIPSKHEYVPHHHEKLYTDAVDSKPPDAFKLSPIQGRDLAPKPPPPSRPFKDTTVFQNVDTHALEVSMAEHSSLRNLVWHLIFARNITNELEKARAIFSWLCCIDLSKLRFDNVQKDSPEELLLNLQRRLTTYCEVYEKLCSYAGLQCKTIGGYAKGSSFKIGSKFGGDQSRHSWNAVNVNGSWRLVDCTWAARKYVDKIVTSKNISYELNDYYFMPNPQQFIFTHFPDDSSWQLLDTPVTMTDFEDMVFVTSTFFKYGLEILSHKKAVIDAKQEERIRIGFPRTKTQPLLFTFSLSNDNGKDEFHGIKLDQFGMQMVVDDEAVFTIRLPEKGSYCLTVYAKHPDPQMGHGKYVNICEYKLLLDRSPVRPLPFPPLAQTSWGSRECAAKYNLVPLEKKTILNTVNGWTEIRIKVPKVLNFSAKLKSRDRDEKALDGYTIHRVVGDVAVFTIMAPSRGEFGLEIWVCDPAVDGNTLYHAYQYLIICDETPKTTEKPPALTFGYLGPAPSFKNFGLSTQSHADPYIETDRHEIKVDFKASRPLRMSSRLLYASGDANDDSSQYILQQSKNDVITLLVKFPKAGFYKLQLYALPLTDESESLPGVYNYLISCANRPGSPAIPFPEQSGKWKEGCYLYEPLEGRLEPNRLSKAQHVRFKVTVPRAKSVVVIVEEEDWTQLDRTPDGSWEGAVNMEKHWGQTSKVTVCAKYEDAKDSYNILLKYSV